MGTLPEFCLVKLFWLQWPRPLCPHLSTEVRGQQGRRVRSPRRSISINPTLQGLSLSPRSCSLPLARTSFGDTEKRRHRLQQGVLPAFASLRPGDSGLQLPCSAAVPRLSASLRLAVLDSRNQRHWSPLAPLANWSPEASLAAGTPSAPQAGALRSPGVLPAGIW